MDFFCKIERVEVKSEEIKEEKPVFFKDKYRPRKKEDFIVNRDIVERIDNMIDLGIGNTFLYGKEDTGKYTLARYIIESYYKHPCPLRECIFTSEGKDLIYFKSVNHYELYVDEHNCNIINLIKNFFNLIIQPINTSTFDKKRNIILIKNVNLLKPEVCNLLKYYLDKHYNNIFILVGKTQVSNIKSFFFNIRVPAPSNENLTKMLKKIIKTKELKVKKKELNYIIERGNRGISRTISLLELCYLDGGFEYYFNSNEKTISFIYKLMKTPSLDGMIRIREYINNLLINNYTFKEISYLLIEKILKDKKLLEDSKMNCIGYITEAEKNFKKGYREIHHLEYCIIKIINLLRK